MSLQLAHLERVERLILMPNPILHPTTSLYVDLQWFIKRAVGVSSVLVTLA